MLSFNVSKSANLSDFNETLKAAKFYILNIMSAVNNSGLCEDMCEDMV